MKNQKNQNWENLLSETELLSSAETIISSVTTGKMSKSEGIRYLQWLCFSYQNGYCKKDENHMRVCLILFQAQVAFLEGKTQELRKLCIRIQCLCGAVPNEFNHSVVQKVFDLSGFNFLKSGNFREAFIVLNEQ